MRRVKKREYKDVDIEAISSEGFGIAKPEGKVVFVENAVPGDNADFVTYKNKKKFEYAKITSLNKPSSKRIEPFCSHFELCGGCKWQHSTYQSQLEYKQSIVEQAFRRIGKLDSIEILPIIGCEKTTFYRNKLEFTFSNRKWLTNDQINSGDTFNRNGLGFHLAGKPFNILDIETCYLQSDTSNKIRNTIKKIAIELKLEFYDAREHAGFLRNVIVRNSLSGEYMVLLIFGSSEKELILSFLNKIKSECKELNSLHYIVNEKVNDSYADLEVVTFYGESYLLETIGEYSFKVRPKSFFQTNPSQAAVLYGVIENFAQLSTNQVLYDLYSGVGSIGLYLSSKVKQLVGVELIDQAIEDAQENAKINRVTNAKFFRGDVRLLLDENFIKTNGIPDVLVTDPPRAGMHKDVVETLLNSGIGRIIYVSCNPSTQARDLEVLKERYNINKVQPVDMFPHTPHIENVVQLELK